jgi:malonyl CoA-acyl carrier protein transacylase
MTGGVLWRTSVQRIADLGVTAMAELGSGNVLSGLNRRIVRRMPTSSLQTMDDIESWCAARED